MDVRPQLLTCTEAATLLGVSGRTVRRWCNDGTLPAIVTEGGHHRLDEAAVWSLRASRGRRAVLRRQSSRPKTAAPTLRCLIVEDDPMQAAALARLVQRVGGADIEMTIEYDGFGAGLALGRALPDLLLLDLELPGLDGLRVLERAGFGAGLRPMRVVVHTGKVSERDREALLAMGVDAIWDKPLRPDQARSALRALFDAMTAQNSASVD
ncbi:MAG: response regulator [Deltaproteobacteria bacterium]|nr:response regulator [Deltaproteobacteria bacterium]